MLKLGNTAINKLYLGSTEIKKAYLGSTLIFDNTVADIIPLDNLISYYRFNNDVTDEVGANDGTPTNITFASGKMGDAGFFNGTNSKVLNTPILTYNSFSVFCWIKTTQTSEKIILSNRSSFNVDPIVLMAINAGKLFSRLRSNAKTGITTLASSVNVNNNTWRFVGFTFNKTTGLQQNYVDGIADTSITYLGGTFSDIDLSSVGVGEINFSYGEWNGGIDGMSFFDRDLSQEEVTAIYDKQNAGNEIL